MEMMKDKSEQLKMYSTRTKFFIALNVITVTLIFLGIIIIINYLASRHYYRRDISIAQERELLDETKNVLSKIKSENKKAKVYFILAPITSPFEKNTKLQAINKLREKLDEIKQRFPTVFDYEIVNALIVSPDYFKQLTKELGELHAFDVIVKVGEGKRTLEFQSMYKSTPFNPRMPSKLESFSGEEVITASMKELIEGGKSTIYFLASHETQSITDTDEQGLNDLKYSLATREHYEIKEIKNLFEPIPVDCDLLIIPNPRKPFSPEEIKNIDKYLLNGGRLLFTVDAYEKPLKIENYFKNKWGTIIGDDIVIDRENLMLITQVRGNIYSQGYDYRVFFIPRVGGMPSHEITSKISNTFALKVYHSRSITKSKDIPQDLSIYPLAKTTDKGWAEVSPNFRTLKKIKFDKGIDIKGPVPIAMAISKELNDKKETRIVVMGDADILTNHMIRDNDTFVMNTIRWLTGKEYMIASKGRETHNTELTISDTQATVISLIVVVFIPLLSLLTSITLFIIRRV